MTHANLIFDTVRLRSHQEFACTGDDPDVSESAPRLPVVEPAQAPVSRVPQLHWQSAGRNVVLRRDAQQHPPQR